LVRQALVWAGWADPAAGRERIRRDGDPELEALGAALVAWRDRWANEAKTVAAVVKELEGDFSEAARDTRDALGALLFNYDGARLNSRALGKALARHAGRIVGGLRFEKGTYRNAAIWSVGFVDVVDFSTTTRGNCQERERVNKGSRGKQTRQTDQTDICLALVEGEL
jgi:hypothetical protein